MPRGRSISVSHAITRPCAGHEPLWGDGLPERWRSRGGLWWLLSWLPWLWEQAFYAPRCALLCPLPSKGVPPWPGPLPRGRATLPRLACAAWKGLLCLACLPGFGTSRLLAPACSSRRPPSLARLLPAAAGIWAALLSLPGRPPQPAGSMWLRSRRTVQRGRGCRRVQQPTVAASGGRGCCHISRKGAASAQWGGIRANG